MITNSALLAEIKALKTAVDGYTRVIVVQNSLIHDLRQDNRDMLNRFMANFNIHTYAQTSPASVAEMDLPAEKLARSDNFSQEFLAGAISDET